MKKLLILVALFFVVGIPSENSGVYAQEGLVIDEFSIKINTQYGVFTEFYETNDEYENVTAPLITIFGHGDTNIEIEVIITFDRFVGNPSVQIGSGIDVECVELTCKGKLQEGLMEIWTNFEPPSGETNIGVKLKIDGILVAEDTLVIISPFPPQVWEFNSTIFGQEEEETYTVFTLWVEKDTPISIPVVFSQPITILEVTTPQNIEGSWDETTLTWSGISSEENLVEFVIRGIYPLGQTIVTANAIWDWGEYPVLASTWVAYATQYKYYMPLIQ